MGDASTLTGRELFIQSPANANMPRKTLFIQNPLYNLPRLMTYIYFRRKEKKKKLDTPGPTCKIPLQVHHNKFKQHLSLNKTKIENYKVGF